ncbi:MAG: DsrE family protein [Gemmatimonadaceae bacterium]|nr:DsrE family protein [Gemmatimonadaceae bacterium]
MRRFVLAVTNALALTTALLLGASSLVRAQAGEALIKQLGASIAVPNPTFPADKSLTYRIAWNVTDAPEKPAEIAPGFRRPANFLTMTDAEGVPRGQVHLAIIVYGPATKSLQLNAHYKAATSADNASIPLLEALNQAGVQVIVCGQALAHLKIQREQLLPFVKVATSATMARATLAAQGYSTFAQ